MNQQNKLNFDSPMETIINAVPLSVIGFTRQ